MTIHSVFCLFAFGLVFAGKSQQHKLEMQRIAASIWGSRGEACEYL